MSEPELQSLWAFGDPERWRRGRVILVTLALFHGIVQGLVFLTALIRGALETALASAIILALWWLLFAFIWFGSHWLRWLLGGWTLLVGFACLIWGIRDDSSPQVVAGTLHFLIGGSLFAPSVHFFAVRQRTEICWPEKLVAAAVFVLLIASFFSALVGVNLYRATIQR